MGADIDGSFQSIEQWKELYPDDVHVAEVCKAFLLLLDGQLEQARFLFETHFPEIHIQNEQLASQGQIVSLFYQTLQICENPLSLEASN